MLKDIVDGNHGLRNSPKQMFFQSSQCIFYCLSWHVDKEMKSKKRVLQLELGAQSA